MSMNAQTHDSKEMAKRLLLSRRDYGWNQDDLSKKSGVSRGYISNIERGYTANVGLEVVFALANALNVSVEYLIGLTDDPLGGLPANEEDENTIRIEVAQTTTRLLVKRLIDLFLTMPRRDQDLLITMAQAMSIADQPRIIGDDIDGGDRR
jgi:transcriptional regulator with XRE-family HTH domain